MVASVSSRF